MCEKEAAIVLKSAEINQIGGWRDVTSPDFSGFKIFNDVKSCVSFLYVCRISEGCCAKDSFKNYITSIISPPPTVTVQLRRCQEQHGCRADIKQR